MTTTVTAGTHQYYITVSTSVSPYYTSVWNPKATEIIKTTVTSTIEGSSWIYDQSVFTYALGTGAAVTTVTEPVTATSFEYDPVTTLKPPPTCAQTSCTIEPDCRACDVEGGTVELLYWADMTKATSWQSLVAIPSSASPVTARYKNYTLTSPTVYIEFRTAYATNACGWTIGGTYPGALVPIHPASLFSIQTQFDFFVTALSSNTAKTSFYQSASFNFADLSGMAPASVYYAQPSCFEHGCGTIYNDYHPVLVVPSQVRSLDPAWKTCGLDFRGSWDPPIALQPGGVVAAVTTETPATYTATAIPESTGEQPAKETGAMISDPSSVVSGPASLVVSFPSATYTAKSTRPSTAIIEDPVESAPVYESQASASTQPEQGSDETHPGTDTVTSMGKSTAATATGISAESPDDTSMAITHTTRVVSYAGPSSLSSASSIETEGSSASAFSPSNAYDVLTAALPPTSTAFVGIVTDPSGILHTIAQEPAGYVFDSSTTVSPGKVATISGLGVVSAGVDDQVYGFASTSGVGVMRSSTGSTATTSAASLPVVASDSSYFPSVIIRTVTREGTTSSTPASGARAASPRTRSELAVIAALGLLIPLCSNL
ncbi:hypothetical protein B0A48_08535 [Cryoendolithus antarcticus]|uniref:Uncharacterized protein n=1 Tax=Cryoendolithus antarcticus TaxID=1507870 RepID=A0A1V8T5R2_9PEZI|nr:hypothetical protein B0A48_08535 [Cryoendolithus antarcticus]